MALGLPLVTWSQAISCLLLHSVFSQQLHSTLKALLVRFVEEGPAATCSWEEGGQWVTFLCEMLVYQHPYLLLIPLISSTPGYSNWLCISLKNHRKALSLTFFWKLGPGWLPPESASPQLRAWGPRVFRPGRLCLAADMKPLPVRRVL